MTEQIKGKIEELPLPRPKEREIMARVRTDTQQQNSLDKQQQQQIVVVWDIESTWMEQCEQIKDVALHVMPTW